MAGNQVGSTGIMWRLEMFGGFRAWHNEQPIAKFSTRKTAGLLAYLASHRGKMVSRDTLADVFWPETDPESARNSLRVALNALRKALSSESEIDVLQTDRLTIRLDPAYISTDIAEFEMALREEARATALTDKIVAATRAQSVYHGPFLEGWYEEWVGTEQNRLSEANRNVLQRLTSYLLEARDYEKALEFALQAVQSDPLREESHRLVIRLHVAMGNPTSAMQQYRELERLLRKELGATPSGATRDLLRQASTPTDQIPPVPSTAHGRGDTPPTVRQQTQTVAPVPPALTAFFGREEEIARLLHLLRPDEDGFLPRLVTLTGLGGSGKSRLAIEAGRKLQSLPGTSVYFVSLTGLAQPAQISNAIASALRLVISADGSPTDQIVQAFSGKRALLILDNFEQAIDTSYDWLKNLLERLPLLSCLVTGRYRLGLTGEQEIPIAPLPVPTMLEAESSALDRLAQIPSIALFADRARAARSDFRLTAQNSASVTAICATLDGLPLAIELAAAWTRLLTPAEMRSRFKERFDLLVASNSDVPQRHRSLRTVLDASYHLLSEEEKAFFARLSVLRGDWKMEAAKAVTRDADAFDRLNVLQQRSLVVFVETEGGSRFRMLETVREYATAQLDARDLPLYRARHAAYFRKVTEEASAFFCTPSAETWLAILDCEIENIRTALDFQLRDGGNAQEGIHLAALLWRYWYSRGQMEEGVHWLEDALAAESETTPPETRVALREGLGRFSLSFGHSTVASRYLEQALQIARTALPDKKSRIACLTMNLGLAAQGGSDASTVRSAFHDLAVMKADAGDMWGEAAALVELGKATPASGENDDRTRILQRARELRQKINDRWGLDEINGLLMDEVLPMFEPSGAGPIYLTLGSIAAEQEDHAMALPLLNDALSAFREEKDACGIATTLERIGLSSLAFGDHRAARIALEEAILLRREGCGAEGVAFSEKLLDRAMLPASTPKPMLS